MKCRKDLVALSFSSLSLVIYNFALEVQVSFVDKKHSYSGWGERLFWMFFPEEHVLNVRFRQGQQSSPVPSWTHSIQDIILYFAFRATVLRTKACFTEAGSYKT